MGGAAGARETLQKQKTNMANERTDSNLSDLQYDVHGFPVSSDEDYTRCHGCRLKFLSYRWDYLVKVSYAIAQIEQ